MKAFKSIGIETEIFLTTGNFYPVTIHNAATELYKILGFNIDANYGGGAYLNLGSGFSLHTDGTPIEFNCHAKSENFAWLVESQVNWIKTIGAGLLKNFKLDWRAFYQSDKLHIFDSAGYIYSSGKTVHNAYTGESFEQKKEEDGPVTKRTAGLHLHFEFRNPEVIKDKTLTNLIVRKMDEIFYAYYGNYDFQSVGFNEREQMTPKGLYRIKNQPNGVTTLEYRQLTTKMLQDKSIYGFVVTADEVINNLIEINLDGNEK